MGFQDFAESREFGERAQRWADAIYFGRPGEQGSFPIGLAFGVYGVGLVRRYGKEDYIALFAAHEPGAPESRLDETDLINPASDDGIRVLLQTVLFGETFDRVGIIRIPPLVSNAAAGTTVHGTTTQGTAGPRVTWTGGRVGFLTAGHVADGTLNVTDGHGTTLGRTLHVFYPGTPASVGGTAPNVDVALIEPPIGAATTRFGAGSPLTGSSPIDLHLATGHSTSTVLGMIGWYMWPSVGGTYVDLYMTNAACTVPGDSGAAVTASGSNDAIGMVVGGTRTFTSFIQDIHTQISALKTVTGLGALSL